MLQGQFSWQINHQGLVQAIHGFGRGDHERLLLVLKGELVGEPIKLLLQLFHLLLLFELQL